ncbi:hypothetical protein Y032_0133g1776 [Ancylostoma ceylanicum]|nr:hypothetical protein Y032_0133g1776 [Ancylostoma ceylanicum]
MVELTAQTQMCMGVLLLVLGVLGIVLCLVEISEIIRQRSINSFKYFRMSHAITHGVAQLVVVTIFISSQLLMFGKQWIDASVVGYVALSFQFNSLYTAFTMSLNRLASLTVPTSYSKIFSPRHTALIVIGTWAFSFTTCSMLLIKDCNFNFIGSEAEFAFSDSQCGQFIARYVDIVYNSVLVMTIIPIDILSLFLLHKIAKKRAERTRYLRKEKPWFIQTLLNSLVFACMLVFFHVAVFFDNAVVRFLMTTVAWEIWLMSPQIIAIILLNDTRRAYSQLFCYFKKKSANVMVARSSQK